MNDLPERTINSTLDLKKGERVRFPSGSTYVKAEDGSLRRGFQKLRKKDRIKARQLVAQNSEAPALTDAEAS